MRISALNMTPHHWMRPGARAMHTRDANQEACVQNQERPALCSPLQQHPFHPPPSAIPSPSAVKHIIGVMAGASLHPFHSAVTSTTTTTTTTTVGDRPRG